MYVYHGSVLEVVLINSEIPGDDTGSMMELTVCMYICMYTYMYVYMYVFSICV